MIYEHLLVLPNYGTGELHIEYSWESEIARLAKLMKMRERVVEHIYLEVHKRKRTARNLTPIEDQ